MKRLLEAIKATGRNIEVEETKPTEMNNHGIIAMFLSDEHLEEFSVSNALSVVSSYWQDIAGSRKQAIESLIKDLEAGFDPMSLDTAYEAGIDLPCQECGGKRECENDEFCESCNVKAAR